MDDDFGTNTVAMFDAECNDTDIEVRLSAMKKLPIVATALGVQRTVNELIPYLDALTESIYNDDEVLLILAEQLGEFLPSIGGTINATLLINLLEKLVTIEESLVREKAIESLKKVASFLDNEGLELLYAPLILRLATTEWFTSKIAAVALFPVCYQQSNKDIKSELRHIYRILCQDDSPLVRRASAAKFADFAKVLEVEWILNEFVPVFNNFAKDDQDSVRVFAVDVGTNIAERLKPKEKEDFVIPTVIELSRDASWRVRYQAANQINALQLALGRDLTQKYLFSIYQNLSHDTEPQVREATARNIVHFCEILRNTYNDTDELSKEVTDPFIVDKMIPLIHDLNEDSNSEVKEALSTVLASLCSVLGEENTKKLLLPIITESLINDSSKVRENIISNLNNIIFIIGVTDIIDTVLKIVTDLLNTSNSVWRTRRNLIVTITYMATHTSKEYFDEHLKILYKKLLNDGVYAIRQTAPLILPILIKNFGMEWAVDSLIPVVVDFSNNKHYLYRFVCIFCIDELISPTLSAKTKYGTNLTYLESIRRVITRSEGSEDRAKMLITRLRVLNKNLDEKFQRQWVQQAFKVLEESNIVDDDVKRYAEDTIEMFVKDNKIDILNVSEREIAQAGDENYLEGILYLSIYQFMPVLKKLFNDPIFNVRLKAAKSILKIQNFSKSLQKELDQTCFESVLEMDISSENLNTCKYEMKELPNNTNHKNETTTSEVSIADLNASEVTEASLELPNEFVQSFEQKLHADK